jgi:hypothetical protein
MAGGAISAGFLFFDCMILGVHWSPGVILFAVAVGIAPVVKNVKDRILKKESRFKTFLDVLSWSVGSITGAILMVQTS